MKKYSVISLKQYKTKPIIDNIVVHGKTPMSAARKAFNKIYRLHDVRTGIITIKDHETEKEHKILEQVWKWGKATGKLERQESKKDALGKKQKRNREKVKY